MRRILITGSLGQIGSELSLALCEKFGFDRVIRSDIRERQEDEIGESKYFKLLDCTQPGQLKQVVHRYDIGIIYHLAALLSATAEAQPQEAWRINMDGLCNVLEAARHNNCAVFFPSSIGAFGPLTPRDGTPQDTIQRPSTIYGITKVSGELLCDYYASQFGTDCRGLRLPGLISAKSQPSGGTTDYATDIFHRAIRNRRYTCYLNSETRLDMMYMPDAIRAIIDLMQADPSNLNHRNAFNITSMNVTPEEIATEIRNHIPEFVIEYKIDPIRQTIADSWPRAVDDTIARQEWGWKPDFDLNLMTTDMIHRLRRNLANVDQGQN